MDEYLGILQRAKEHFIEAQGVCTILVHHIIWVDHIATALAHLVSLCCHPRVRMLLPDMFATFFLDLCRIKPADKSKVTDECI